MASRITCPRRKSKASSFIYRARRPFVPERQHAFFNRPWPGVVRANGFFWIATRPGFVGELSQVGAIVRHQALGYWWAAVPQEHRPGDAGAAARIRRGGHEVWGDRRRQIVFIWTSEMD